MEWCVMCDGIWHMIYWKWHCITIVCYVLGIGMEGVGMGCVVQYGV